MIVLIIRNVSRTGHHGGDDIQFHRYFVRMYGNKITITNLLFMSWMLFLDIVFLEYELSDLFFFKTGDNAVSRSAEFFICTNYRCTRIDFYS